MITVICVRMWPASGRCQRTSNSKREARTLAASVTRRAAAACSLPSAAPRFSRALLKLNLMSGHLSSGEVTCRPLNEYKKTAGTPQYLGGVPAEQLKEMHSGRRRIIWISHGRHHAYTRIRRHRLKRHNFSCSLSAVHTTAPMSKLRFSPHTRVSGGASWSHLHTSFLCAVPSDMAAGCMRAVLPHLSEPEAE